jgi:class 3 adenylate cyclase
VTDGEPPSIARGFLFADLRGYSAWVERHGDQAASILIGEYRELVRRAVAEHRGAEIKTEGDSFYVAFDSPSMAVRCGLRIVQLAAESSAAAGGPIPVGVGVHAGETVATDEGFVGSAVNVAARVCGQARSGEVLVTDAVRSLTRTYLDAAFRPLGRRRLKGISEPMSLYRVTPGRTVATVPGWRRIGRNRSLVAAALAIPLIIVVAVTGGALVRELAAQSGSDESPSATLVAATPATTPSISATPTSGVDVEFPTAAEAALVQLIPQQHRDACRRGDPEQRPIVAVLTDFPGVEPVQRAPWSAGIQCDLGGITAPDDVWLWELVPGTGAGRAGIVGGDPAEQALAVHAGLVDATPGTCREQRPTVESWSFGGDTGGLVCYETDEGDAVVLWVFDDGHLFGKAVRDDRDMVALLDWWEDVGRFAAP